MYGQLWIVYAQEPPQYLALVDFQPLARDWSEVELSFAMPGIWARAGGFYSGMMAGALCVAVLSPGSVEYAAHRVLFTAREATITRRPDTFAALRDDEPLICEMTCTPDFQDLAARAWAAVWRERIGCWLRRRVPGYARLMRWYRRKSK